MSLDRILSFLSEIGIVVRDGPLPEVTFLPGVLIDAGGLVIDRAKLAHSGDLLHEAGHLAVTPPSQRAALAGNLQTGPAEELAAIAWSYAACLHLEIDPAVVFHADGYRGTSPALIENFTAGRYLGVPLLQWYGLTRERANGSGAAVYPCMSRWLRLEAPGPAEAAIAAGQGRGRSEGAGLPPTASTGRG